MIVFDHGHFKGHGSMYLEPYEGIYPVVQEVLQDLILPEDRYHQTHLRRIARTLHVLLDQKPEGRLLELGTGAIIPLALKELLPNLEVEVTNFNEDQPPVHMFAASINGRYGEFPAYRVDLEYDQIPVDNEYYDWVLCCEVVEHMEIDPMFMMSEINRVTKTGGGLLLTTPNIVSSRGLTKMMYGVEPYFYMQYHIDRQYHRHNYEYSVHSLVKLVKAAGFDGKIRTEDNFENGVTDIPNKLKSAGFTVSNIGDNIMTVAHKKSEVIDRHPVGIYDVRGEWHE